MIHSLCGTNYDDLTFHNSKTFSMRSERSVKPEVKPKLGEEIANAVTHGIGALLALIALVLMIVFSREGSRLSFTIYGITLVTLYLASTLYHSLVFTRAKKLFRKFDHMAIFLLIAGTYTPFCLTALTGWLRWTMLALAGC